MSDSDKFVLDSALDQQDLTVPFQQKRWQEITDQNASNGSFTGQITFDLSNLSSMNQWANLSEAYVNFPVKFSISNAGSALQTITSGGPSLYAMCPKGGWHSFVDSVSLTIGSTNIMSPNIYNNVSTSFKMLSEWSADELQKYGPTLGVAIDDYKIDQDGDVEGGLVGLEQVSSGNLFATAAGFRLNNTATNDAFEERAYSCNSAHTAASSAVNAILGSSAQAIGKNSSDVASAAAASEDVYVCYALATIRLKDISDVISKLPPMKSVKGMLTINYNAAEAVVAYNASGGVVAINSISSQYGRTMPAMVRGGSSGFAPVVSGGSTWRIKAEVSATPSNLSAKPPQTNARLYCPVYVASPEVDRALSMKKTIRYLERYQTTLTIEPNQSYSGAISAGIQNPRRLTLSNYFTECKDSANPLFGRILSTPLLSPFSHEGFGTSPFAAIRDWQVDVSGRPVFQSPMTQDFHTFLQEITECGLNGGKTHQFQSGLLNKRLWDQLYRFYTVDLSRRISGEDGASVSVQTSFTNATNLKTLCVANLDHEKEITVDTQFGIITQGL
jgi:hypothetical protein